MRINPFKMAMKTAKKYPKTAPWAVLLEKSIALLDRLADVGRQRLKKLEDAAKNGSMSALLVLILLVGAGCSTAKIERTCWPMIIRADEVVDAVEEYEIVVDDE